MRKKINPSRARWILISGFLIVLVGLVWYGYEYNPTVSLQMCLNDPLLYDGREIDAGMETKVVEIIPDGFILQQGGRTIRVMGDRQNASPGDYVGLQAVFHKEGYLELKSLYVAKGRRLKIVLSALPVLLVLFLLFKNFRFDWRRLLFIERS